MPDKVFITVEATVDAPLETVWDCWTKPEHITHWNAASDDWHAPHATNDLREGGTFTCRMEAKDGSVGFDFGGTYSKVIEHEHIAYKMDDDRTVEITFAEKNGGTHVIETFQAETENSVEMQKEGWQAILDNFKRYTEAQVQ